ncbi:hypothetical protein NM688_g6340 [Phlebia brevispora]|uniref:Uncharacterized protein n=1 Tax=Phlebia brevispora TaxID=194682 RepID=A0ACC1SH67_9APHY|nr:hypothetical protein NM688_g6340 [Phlebia brevispora]
MAATKSDIDVVLVRPFEMQRYRPGALTDILLFFERRDVQLLERKAKTASFASNTIHHHSQIALQVLEFPVFKMLKPFLRSSSLTIDTARIYCGGTAEGFIGKLDLKGRGLKVETKLYPNTASYGDIVPNSLVISHSPEDLRKYLDMSLKALNVNQLEMWYLHGPDRTTPYEVTMKAVNDLYKEGKFKRFGISNYMSWEVAELVEICKANGYIQPTTYQGIYNAIHRTVEPELFPCLRNYGISFYAFNPLAGGFFTGRYHSISDKVEPGSRFDSSKALGQHYRNRYWTETYFNALNAVDTVVSKHGLTLAEVPLRWMAHHSLLKREYGDKVIIGASSLGHIKQNLVDLEKAPLPGDVVHALDEAWNAVKGSATHYYH